MDEVEIIEIPCENYKEKQARLISALLEIAKALNIDRAQGKQNDDKEPEVA